MDVGQCTHCSHMLAISSAAFLNPQPKTSLHRLFSTCTQHAFSPPNRVLSSPEARCVECWGWHLSLNIDHLLFLSTSSDAVGDGLADSL